jgi:hypothetical protein
MSLARRVIKFAAREVATSGLSAIGQHLGDAIGTVLGRRIDPDHGKEPTPPADDDKAADGPTPAPGDS